jgi:hypothetical protein
LFAFAYDVSELGNGQFDHFVYDLRGERLRFRRDALCASYHRSHPFEFDDQGGKRRADVYYGRIAQFSGPYVCVEGWQFDARRSERVFWFEREMVDRVGEFESDEPVRIVCVEDLVSSNRVSRQYEMYKWEGLGLRTHIQLLPDEDFGCLDEQRA